MDQKHFREEIFKGMAQRLGIDKEKTPYSTRHTFSNKIKNVKGANSDKAALISHADYETTQKFYQSATLEDLKNITNQIE